MMDFFEIFRRPADRHLRPCLDTSWEFRPFGDLGATYKIRDPETLSLARRTMAIFYLVLFVASALAAIAVVAPVCGYAMRASHVAVMFAIIGGLAVFVFWWQRQVKILTRTLDRVSKGRSPHRDLDVAGPGKRFAEKLLVGTSALAALVAVLVGRISEASAIILIAISTVAAVARLALAFADVVRSRVDE